MLLIPNEPISKYFDLEELTTTSEQVDNTPGQSAYQNLKYRLGPVLDQIYEQVGSFSVISGFRSDFLNELIGGAANSYHTRGLAADIAPSWPMNATDFWLKIYDSPLRSSLGEIALKKNVIHLSLADPPLKVGVPLDARSGSYLRMSKSDIEALRGETGVTEPSVVLAGAGVLALGVAVSLLIYRIKRK